MMYVVFIVEKMDYYLEWFNVYWIVDVVLVMYDVGGFSEFDICLVE